MHRFDNVTVRNVGGTCRQGQNRLSPLHPFWIHGFKRHDPLARGGFELLPQRRLVVCDELSTLPPRLISAYRVFCVVRFGSLASIAAITVSTIAAITVSTVRP